MLISTNCTSIIITDYKTDKSDTEKLLGVKFDKKLTSDNHISDIYQKAGRKISALARQKQSSRGALCKNVFLEISQNSQENTCAIISFLIKLQA